MKKIRLIISFLVIALAFAGNAIGKTSNKEHHIIPQPVSYVEGKSAFTLNTNTIIQISPSAKELGKIADLINERLKAYGLPSLKTNIKREENQQKNTLLLWIGDFGKEIGDEGYYLEVNKKFITIKANTTQGIFYGVQSLFQLLPELPNKSTIQKNRRVKIASCKITDYPRFTYRGLHLDVCRHFYPVEFVKKYIDIMSMYKMNTLHWHLTDDQGWRLEIKKYPLLTEISAFRKSTAIGRNTGEDNIPYGGFYSQEQAREVVEYAASRQVEVIPEIEMPGHAIAALAAYPELSCTGGPHEVWTQWGINDEIFCAGNDETFNFLQNILLEVMDIFPSKYIHIGGDEAPKTRWESCEKCQQRMKDENLKDEHELQSYFIKRMEKFVSKHGRQIIGWDEILEGGLAPGATVMSWRGMEGGIEAARSGHDVIMTPTDYCYLDYYQADPAGEPFGIGGYVPLKKVYSFEPVPDVLTEKESKHILGAQGNIWTEYIAKPDMVEYMVYPRALALAEINWSPKEARNWEDFNRRFIQNFNLLNYKKVNFSQSSLSVAFEVLPNTGTNGVWVKLTSDYPEAKIYYYSNSSKGNTKEVRYTNPVNVVHSQTIHAYVHLDGEEPMKVTKLDINVNDATGKVPVLNTIYEHQYAANGTSSLTDGIRGNPDNINKNWLGFLGVNADIVLDLGEMQQIDNVSLGSLHNPENWIFLPTSIEFFLSEDGMNYQPAKGNKPSIITPKDPMLSTYTIINMNTKARYIKIVAKNKGICPKGHWGEGNPAWLFVDEIMVNSEL
ncbi:MAG: family 20 glycosylhydrolase [Lentimicrobium sp.]|jgi:hexosaminidase|nr:family 20 glycosylhydrolase [Lentimicrobium sp.]